jgi:hypothetical protein
LHQPGTRYDPAGVERPNRRTTPAGRERGATKGAAAKGGSSAREVNEADKAEQVIEAITDNEDKVIALNSTQSVVVDLLTLLPKAIYYVFVVYMGTFFHSFVPFKTFMHVKSFNRLRAS